MTANATFTVVSATIEDLNAQNKRWIAAKEAAEYRKVAPHVAYSADRSSHTVLTVRGWQLDGTENAELVAALGLKETERFDVEQGEGDMAFYRWSYRLEMGVIRMTDEYPLYF